MKFFKVPFETVGEQKAGDSCCMWRMMSKKKQHHPNPLYLFKFPFRFKGREFCSEIKTFGRDMIKPPKQQQRISTLRPEKQTAQRKIRVSIL